MPHSHKASDYSELNAAFILSQQKQPQQQERHIITASAASSSSSSLPENQQQQQQQQPLKDGLFDSQHVFPLPPLVALIAQPASSIWVCVGCAALAVFFSKLNLGISFVGLLIAVAVYTVPVCVAATRDSYDWLKRKDQGSKTTATCASPEFINACLQTLFPIIDKSVFNHFIDLFEQNFQLLKPPPLIESIKIADFDLGIHAPRIQHLKLVPQGQQRSADENQTAILFDAEIEMQPTTAEGGMFFVVIAGIGERQMGIVPISIRVSSVGFRIRARIHCTLTPHFPFTHMARISLLEQPVINFAAKPMGTMNVMSLPVISQFVNIVLQKTICDLCLAPKVLQLDLVKILLGDDSLDDSIIAGIFEIHLKQARNLIGTDATGFSDPYISVEIPGHPSPKRACSRAVEKCLDPVFDEILYVIITEQDVIEDRKLRLHVYDKDKMSKDDVLGFCNFSIAQLLSSSKLSDSRVLHEGASQLLNDIDGSPAKNKKGLSCELDSTISFHPKPKASSSSSSSSKYPVSLSSAAASTIKWTRVEDAVKFRAGMLVIQIHEARGLMRDSKSGGGNKLPYSYCKLYVNGVKCVQSRTCPNNQTPVYNETIELFVGDWMSEPLLSLKVKHVKPAETDETLGEIVFDMESIFSREMHMSATRWFPVVNDGLENGKIRLSFHFRSLMTTHVPRDVMFTSHDDYNFDGLNLNSFIFTLAPTTKMMLKEDGSDVFTLKLNSFDYSSTTTEMCKIGTEHFIEWKTPLLLNNNPHQKLASLIKFEILHDKDVIAVGDFSLHELILKQGSDLDFVVKTMKGEFTVNFTNIIATTTSTTASTNTGFKFKAKRFFGKLTSGSNKDLSSSNSPAKELAHHTVFKQGSITIFNCVG